MHVQVLDRADNSPTLHTCRILRKMQHQLYTRVAFLCKMQHQLYTRVAFCAKCNTNSTHVSHFAQNATPTLHTCRILRKMQFCAILRKTPSMREDKKKTDFVNVPHVSE
jgi:hypothetical protein